MPSYALEYGGACASSLAASLPVWPHCKVGIDHVLTCRLTQTKIGKERCFALVGHGMWPLVKADVCSASSAALQGRALTAQSAMVKAESVLALAFVKYGAARVASMFSQFGCVVKY